MNLLEDIKRKTASAIASAQYDNVDEMSQARRHELLRRMLVDGLLRLEEIRNKQIQETQFLFVAHDAQKGFYTIDVFRRDVRKTFRFEIKLVNRFDSWDVIMTCMENIHPWHGDMSKPVFLGNNRSLVKSSFATSTYDGTQQSFWLDSLFDSFARAFANEVRRLSFWHQTHKVYSVDDPTNDQRAQAS